MQTVEIFCAIFSESCLSCLQYLAQKVRFIHNFMQYLATKLHDCHCPLAVVLVQAVSDSGAFDFCAGHAILYFAECQCDMQFDACWWMSCYEQKQAHCHLHPHLVCWDQHELLALFHQFLLNSNALLEIHVCQVVFVLHTTAGIPLRQLMHCCYKNRR
jgi:hypothetical protein